MDTGENTQGLRAIADLTRKASFILLALNFYVFCYAAFDQWGLTWDIIKRILQNFGETGIFNSLHYTKSFSFLLLCISLFGSKGKKDEKIKVGTISKYLSIGALLYWGSFLVFYLNWSTQWVAISYIATTIAGFMLFMAGGARLSRLIQIKLTKDIFNEENETFPQEERLLENEFSVNLPGTYRLKGKTRSMWLNLINCFRLVLVAGSPGAGKTFFIIREVIIQCIRRSYCIILYDFKYDDLSIIAYNAWLKYKHLYPVPPKFYVINFDTPINRCNPLEPSTLLDITDATESSRTILLGLNFQWIQKTGDFFVESPINFFTAIIWFLKKYKGGLYCTLPHAIELMQSNYDDLFPILSTEPEIEVLIG
ncbi:YWFCY domain-containing protein [Chitinophaga defluvii]|uniref:YWFCY domain-containing protein n=1 Tax=Chitinophaga defluvii TaxID=3163343 RepID=A0ABV2T8M2_9BACT